MANAKKQPKKASNTIVSRQKTLLPTLKEQQRYLVYKVLSAEESKSSSFNNNFEKIHNDILAQSNLLLGIFEGAKAGIMGAKYNPDKQTGIIRVNNKYVDKLKVCLGLIKNSNNKNIIVDCIYVSGVINKAIDKMNN